MRSPGQRGLDRLCQASRTMVPGIICQPSRTRAPALPAPRPKLDQGEANRLCSKHYHKAKAEALKGGATPARAAELAKAAGRAALARGA
jgi:hypothetical protein